MDFLSSLIALAIPYGFSADQVTTIHSNYCQNLYFRPDSLEKMLEYECNVWEIELEIARVKSGRY
jgi:hypothetical protein